MYLIQHSTIIFLFFTFPFFGWILYKSFQDKVIKCILAISLILLSPIISNYSYVIDNLYAFLLYISLSCVYSLFIKLGRDSYKILIKPLLFSFVFFGLISFVGAFNGTISIEQEWNVKDYKIQHIRSQGFSGGPLMTYELYKYATIPIFIKHVESKVDSGNLNICDIKFKYENFDFNECQIQSYSNSKILLYN